MADEEPQELEEQAVVVQLAGEAYAVDIARVQEIIRPPKITAVPRAPRAVEGVANLRGSVIPVVDLRVGLGLEATEPDGRTRIVVAEVGGQTVGFIVDGVSEVLRIPRGVVEPPSPLVADVHSDYLRGIAKLEDRLVMMIDLDKVLSSGEKRSLAEVTVA